ncbi:hypothetical protein BDZ91DRAFT_618300, partial [Kalaharituber pfeilii]
ETYHCLITGANSGLGLSLCSRFLTTFLQTRPEHHHLVLVFTTRSPSKSQHALSTILSSLPALFAPERVPSERYRLEPAFVDLTSLVSVYELARELREKYDKIDWIYCNAGILTTVRGGAVNWSKAVYEFLIHPIRALTTPNYKLQEEGQVVLQRVPGEEGRIEDGIGMIFCANVFGHYVLVRAVWELLCRGGATQGERARVVWTSSMDAHGEALDLNDIEAVKVGKGREGAKVYESSKRLTDVLALTADLGAVRKGILGHKGDGDGDGPGFYLTHPAVCATNISGLGGPLWYVMLFLFYVVRVVFGSPWHPIVAWKGNSANMFVGMESEEELERRGKVKWGSGATRWGEEMLIDTEVAGVVEGKLTEEMERVGVECWRKLEELRSLWEGRLERE